MVVVVVVDVVVVDVNVIDVVVNDVSVVTDVVFELLFEAAASSLKKV